MCLRACELWTWRLMSVCIACVGMLLSFVFGPLQTVIYLTDRHSEMSRLLQTEANLATALWFVVAFMWLILVAKIILFVGCYRNSSKLVALYLAIAIGHLIVAFNVCMWYVILCSFWDRKCFDHSPAAQADGGLAAVGAVFSYVTYAAAWLVVLFVVWNYKLSLACVARFIS